MPPVCEFYSSNDGTQGEAACAAINLSFRHLRRRMNVIPQHRHQPGVKSLVNPLDIVAWPLLTCRCDVTFQRHYRDHAWSRSIVSFAHLARISVVALASEWRDARRCDACAHD